MLPHFGGSGVASTEFGESTETPLMLAMTMMPLMATWTGATGLVVVSFVVEQRAQRDN